MKIKLINIYSFPVRAKTDWLVLEMISENNIKGYSELTMSNYYERDELIKQITEEKLKRELRNYKSFKPDFEYF